MKHTDSESIRVRYTGFNHTLTSVLFELSAELRILVSQNLSVLVKNGFRGSEVCIIHVTMHLFINTGSRCVLKYAEEVP